MKKVLLTLTAFVAWMPFLAAQDALPFTRIDRNPVTSAFAGAGAASNGTAAYSAFGGAAMLPFYNGTLDAAVSYQRWSPALSLSNNVSVGAAYKITPRVGLSLGYTLENGASYDVYESPGAPSGKFYPKNHVIALGFGAGITDFVSVGLNVRYAREILAPGAMHDGFNADLFAGFQLNEGLRLTAGVSTLGTLVEKTWKQPASLKVAVDWAPLMTGNHVLDIMADADYYFSGSFSAAAGLQYTWKQLLFVRAGYRYAPEASVIPRHLALGLGVQFYGLRLDVSYLTASSTLGNTLNLGLAYSF